MALTANFYAGDTDKLFVVFTSSGNHIVAPSNGQLVQAWQDEATTASRDMLMRYYSTFSQSPSYQTSVMLRPCLQFTQASSHHMGLMNNTGSSSKAFSTLVAASGKTIISAFQLTAAATNNANIYQNTALIADTSGYSGIHFKTISGLHYAYAYNWDGTADTTTGIQISLNTTYVLMLRHDGTTLHMSVLSGAGGATRVDQSVASGATTSLTTQARVGISSNGSFLPAYVGEIYCDNTEIGSTNTPLTDIVGRWLPAAATATGNMFLCM